MSIKKARKTLQNKEKFNYDILDKVANSGGYHPSLLPGAPSPVSYQVIFAGSPNWCGTIAPPLASWLYKNDLSGKILLPFYSHCGGVEADFRKDIAKLCPKADVREPLQTIGDGGGQLKELIGRWLRENKIRERQY